MRSVFFLSLVFGAVFLVSCHRETPTEKAQRGFKLIGEAAKEAAQNAKDSIQEATSE